MRSLYTWTVILQSVSVHMPVLFVCKPFAPVFSLVSNAACEEDGVNGLHEARGKSNWCTGEGGLQAVMELLHLFLEAPRWEESAMDRAKQMYLSHYKSLNKGLERATADRVMSCMLGPDR